MRYRLVVASLCSISASAAVAQSTNYSTAQTPAGGAVRLGYYGAAGKGCVPEPLPTIEVVSPPRHGVVTVRSGSLTTNKLPSCPKLKLPVQIVFYRAQSGYAGADRVVFGVKRSSGKVDIWSFSIDVKEASPLQSPSNNL